MVFTSWNGLLAPKGLPESVKTVIVQAFERTVKDPEVLCALTKIGYVEFYLGPGETDKIIQADSKKIRDVLEKAGLLKK